jgi:YhcH/YjgK/YiaL family protein
MILDSIHRLRRYAHVIPHWDVLEPFLARTDLATLEPGTIELMDRDVYVIVADDAPRPDKPLLEAHRRYIDIQLAVVGAFDVHWHPLAACTEEAKPYDEVNDYLLMSDKPSQTVTLVPGLAAVFFPDDAHAPQPPAVATTKIVCKVAVSAAEDGMHVFDGQSTRR